MPKVSQIERIILRNIILAEPVVLRQQTCNFLQPFNLRDNAYQKDKLPKKVVVWWDSKYIKFSCTLW